MLPQNILPTIILFERYWDETHKEFILESLPAFAKEGYDTYCTSVPETLNKNEILVRLQNGINESKEALESATRLLRERKIEIKGNLSDCAYDNLAYLMLQYVSSTHAMKVAEKIKHLPAALKLKEVFEKADQLNFTIKGIDIEEREFYSMIDSMHSLSKIEEKKEKRIKNFVQNLLTLRKEGRGIIFSCGALLADSLQKELENQGIKENDVIFCFPHSPKNYSSQLDDITVLNQALLHKSHVSLSNQEEIKSLSTKIITEIKTKKSN